MGFNEAGLDFMSGTMEGGSAGVGILAALKGAGIAAGPYAPWIIGGSMAASTLGKFMGRSADKPAERMNFRLGSQQLELNALQIQEQKRLAAEERAKARKQKAMKTSLSKVFAAYGQLKGGV